MNKMLIGIIGIIVVVVIGIVSIIVLYESPFATSESSNQIELLGPDYINFTNPIMKDGVVIESDDPCAASSNLVNCRQNIVRGEERNADIIANTMKIYMSVPQTEGVDPEHNYWMDGEMNNLVEAIEAGDCETITAYEPLMLEQIAALERISDSQLEAFSIVMIAYSEISQAYCE